MGVCVGGHGPSIRSIFTPFCASLFLYLLNEFKIEFNLWKWHILTCMHSPIQFWTANSRTSKHILLKCRCWHQPTQPFLDSDYSIAFLLQSTNTIFLHLIPTSSSQPLLRTLWWQLGAVWPKSKSHFFRLIPKFSPNKKRHLIKNVLFIIYMSAYLYK